jgi:rubredoxin
VAFSGDDRFLNEIFCPRHWLLLFQRRIIAIVITERMDPTLMQIEDYRVVRTCVLKSQNICDYLSPQKFRTWQTRHPNEGNTYVDTDIISALSTTSSVAARDRSWYFHTLHYFQYINSKFFEMYKLILALLLAVSCEAFTLPHRVNANVGSRHSYTAFRMSEEPTTAVADPMDDAMEEVDEGTRKQLEKMKRAQALREQEVFMKKSTGIHKCTNCDWEYDETKGDSMMIGGMIKPGTEFSGLPADWRCPVCRASKDAFQEVVEEIPGFEVNQGYGFGSNAWTSGQKNLAIFGGLAAFFVLFLSGYALS